MYQKAEGKTLFPHGTHFLHKFTQFRTPGRGRWDGESARLSARPGRPVVFVCLPLNGAPWKGVCTCERNWSPHRELKRLNAVVCDFFSFKDGERSTFNLAIVGVGAASASITNANLDSE